VIAGFSQGNSIMKSPVLSIVVSPAIRFCSAGTAVDGTAPASVIIS
jgi:hypothetical protein